MIGSSIVSSPEDGLRKLARHASIGLAFVTVVELVVLAVEWFDATRGPYMTTRAAFVVAFAALTMWSWKRPVVPTVAGTIGFAAATAVTFWVDPHLFIDLPVVGFSVVAFALLLEGVRSARSHAQAVARSSATVDARRPGSAIA